MITFPDGYLLDDMIVFPRAVSRGFELALPDLRQAQPAARNALAAAWQSYLLLLPDHVRLQFQAHRDADFSGALARYDQNTEATTNAWARLVRKERHARYSERMRTGQLVRDRLLLFISVNQPDMPGMFASPMGLEARYRAMLDQAGEQLKLLGDNLARILEPQGGYLTPLKDVDHYRHFCRFLNPSLDRRADFEMNRLFDPGRSIHANCWWSEAAGADFGFALDQQYHAIRVVTRWSRQMAPDTWEPIWQLPGPNFRATVNLCAQAIPALILREERALKRLEALYAAEGKPSLVPTIEKKRSRIQNLSGGYLRPFHAEVIFHTWASTREELVAQCAALEQTVHRVGAQYFAPSLPTTSKRLFAQSWPGFPWGGYTHYQLYAESNFVPHLLPMAGFTGYVDAAEALYESPQDNLVGIRTISGGAPQHLIVIGGTGSGKSMLLGDLISQVMPHLGLLAITDFGQSHETLARVLDPECVPLVLTPNVPFTINYLATDGLPLTSEHLNEASGMAALMAGQADSERDDRLRRSLAAKAIRQLYRSRFGEIERDDPERAFALTRRAMLLRERQGQAPAEPIEAFVDFRDWLVAHPAEAAERLERIPESEVVRFLKGSGSRDDVLDYAASDFAPEEYPTHRELHELLMLQAAGTVDPVLGDLATFLGDWCRGGMCGQLLDGASTFSLQRPVIYWELGQLKEKSSALQLVARHLVNNQTWRQIYARPRSVRKFLLFEEASTFLDMPGAESFLRRAYEQARKFNAVLATVFQTYSRLRALPIRAGLMANTQQFLLLKQEDPTDLTLLAEDVSVPASVMDAIKRFPKPADAGHAAFTLLSRDTPHPICGVARHVAGKEMHYVSCSTPAHAEDRRNALRGQANLLPKIQNSVL